MSAIDQAFIRAYESDEGRPGPRRVASAPSRAVAASSAPDMAAVTAAVAQPAFMQSPIAAASRPLPAVAPTPMLPPAPSVAAPLPRSTAPSERRPLSTFSQSSPTVEARFKPALEVDAFRWPIVSNHLLQNCRQRLRPALETLLAADEAGRSLIGVGSPAAGVGCTTVLTCLARLLIETGKTVAIVDGNFAKPGLGAHLGLAVDAGWEDVLAGNASLAEAVVHSLADRLSLLPLAAGGAVAAQRLDSIHASVTAGVLRYHYDIVLFDLGAVGDPVQGPIARRIIRQCRLDGALVAAGLGPTAALPQRLVQSAPELATICLGVVENQLRAA